MKHISKTVYLEYLACAKNTWLRLHRPDLAEMFELSDSAKSLTTKGNLVELWARKLFPKGVLISEFGEAALKDTQRLLDRKEEVIFQSAFLKDNFLVRNDILEYNQASNSYNLYEVKGTNSVEENAEEIDHIEDLSFQAIVLKDLGLELNEIYLIHLNRDYLRGDEISVSDLFIQEDVSEQVVAREVTTRARMDKAQIELTQTDEKALECQCLYLGRKKHCATFNYSYPDLPQYSIHDLSRIGSSKNSLAELVNSGTFKLDEIPEDFKLSQIQRNQVDVYQSKIPIIDHLAIKNELDLLEYPLYFFDYESYPAAIPLFPGFKPYQQIPFQFSLDVLTEANGDLKHYEYLHLAASDPSESIIKALKENIADRGSIIVWHKSFEKGRNEELAERHPNYLSFLNNLNERIYDLKDIFQKQFYVHEGFKGRVSIKNILPVLVPELSYQDLEIKEGGTAMELWFEKIFQAKSETEKQSVADNLLKYCALDTYAMYAIWRVLKEL